jgi:hypothetical protein
MISKIGYGYKNDQWNAQPIQLATFSISQTALPWKQQDQTSGSLSDTS